MSSSSLVSSLRCRLMLELCLKCRDGNRSVIQSTAAHITSCTCSDCVKHVHSHLACYLQSDVPWESVYTDGLTGRETQCGVLLKIILSDRAD